MDAAGNDLCPVCLRRVAGWANPPPPSSNLVKDSLGNVLVISSGSVLVRYTHIIVCPPVVCRALTFCAQCGEKDIGHMVADFHLAEAAGSTAPFRFSFPPKRWYPKTEFLRSSPRISNATLSPRQC